MQVLAARHVIGEKFVHDPLHVPIIYSKFGHTMGESFEDIKDEIWAGFESEVGPCNGECLAAPQHLYRLTASTPDWQAVKALATMSRIIMRTTHRGCVGLPLCG